MTMGKLEDAYNQARHGLLTLGDVVPKVLPPTAPQTTAPMHTADDQSELCFQHSVLCQIGLPYRDPKDARVWDREQRGVALHIDAGYIFNPRTHKYEPVPLPWGPKPRLILAHLNAEALRAQSPTIEIADSLSAFVRRIRGFDGGREIAMFKEQLKRLSTAIIRLTTTTEMSTGNESAQNNLPLVSGFNLWFPKDERQRVLWNSTIRLSHEYFESLRRHAVPLREADLAALAYSAAALDIYAWLAQRLYRIDPKRPTFISWAALKEQFGQGYDRMDNFKRFFRKKLGRVHERYQTARIELDDRGMIARNSPPPVAKRITLVKKIP
jgi:hypothetical protein